uniref:Uncharacterized protein n=1 Tax=Rhizophora mucronata TaxID=61149 RepID=A0A2P2MZP5_RHIMU
MRRRRVQI